MKKKKALKRRFWRVVGVVVKNVVYAVAGLGIVRVIVPVLEELMLSADSRLVLEFFLSWMLLCWFIDYMENNHFCAKKKK